MRLLANIDDMEGEVRDPGEFVDSAAAAAVAATLRTWRLSLYQELGHLVALSEGPPPGGDPRG
jgi:hypothetical protein